MFGLSVLCACLMPPIPQTDAAPDRSLPTLGELRAAGGDYANTLRTLAKDAVVDAGADPLCDGQLAGAAVRGAGAALHAGHPADLAR